MFAYTHHFNVDLSKWNTAAVWSMYESTSCIPVFILHVLWLLYNCFFNQSNIIESCVSLTHFYMYLCFYIRCFFFFTFTFGTITRHCTHVQCSIKLLFSTRTFQSGTLRRWLTLTWMEVRSLHTSFFCFVLCFSQPDNQILLFAHTDFLFSSFISHSVWQQWLQTNVVWWTMVTVFHVGHRHQWPVRLLRRG